MDRDGGSRHSHWVTDEPQPLDLSRVTTLGAVLARDEEFEPGWSVYVRCDTPGEFTADSPVLLVFDLWEDVEAEAAEARWKPGLGSDIVWDVMTNARTQRPDANLDDFVKAFVYYLRHDAFTDFGDS